jgi:hypothetical protein
MDEEKDVEQMIPKSISSSSSSTAGSARSGLIEPLLVNNNRLNTTSQLAIVGAKVCPIESLDYEYLSIIFIFFFIIHDGINHLCMASLN